jgi:hypothetical protein
VNFGAIVSERHLAEWNGGFLCCRRRFHDFIWSIFQLDALLRSCEMAGVGQSKLLPNPSECDLKVFRNCDAKLFGSAIIGKEKWENFAGNSFIFLLSNAS